MCIGFEQAYIFGVKSGGPLFKSVCIACISGHGIRVLENKMTQALSGVRYREEHNVCVKH